MTELTIDDWTGEAEPFGQPISDEERAEIAEAINHD